MGVQRLPDGLGFDGEPMWWPVAPLLVAGLMVGATIRYLPGRGGHSPADGFEAGGPPAPIELPGIFLAALGRSRSAPSWAQRRH